MKRFLRGVLLFLQCLLTWPWAMPLAACYIGWQAVIWRRNGLDTEELWRTCARTMVADWKMRLAWVRTGE